MTDSQSPTTNPSNSSKGNLDATLRPKLKDLAAALRDFHKALLEKAREDYEAAHGAVESPFALFHLVTEHPEFQWLRPLSGLMATLDEVLFTKGLELTQQHVQDVERALNSLFAKSDLNFADFRAGLETAQARPDVVKAEAALQAAREKLRHIQA